MNNNLPIHPEAKEKIAAGRGQGWGSTYVPWFKVPEFSTSTGKRNWVKGYRSGRDHHTASILEAKAVVLFDHDNTVEDMCEQRMIGPIEETREIANDLKLQHPRFQGCLVPVTTDLMIRYVGGVICGRTMKYVQDLDDPRVGEKFDIEEEWYRRRGWDWGVVTEREIDHRKARNLFLIRAHADPKYLSLRPDKVERVRFWSEAVIHDALSFADMAEACEFALALPYGSVMQTYVHFIASGRWQIDLSKKWDMGAPGRCRETRILNEEGTQYVAVAA